MWEFRDSQVAKASQALAILREYKLVYLAMEERTGKTGTLFKLLNSVDDANDKTINVLILTKAAAVEDIKKQLRLFPVQFNCEVSSYHSVHKAVIEPDIIALDEAHNYLSSSPKPGKIWKDVYRKVYGKPLVYMSATPHAQGYQMLYHQFKLSKWSPWKTYSNFYNWYKVYAWRDKSGNTEVTWINGRNMETYKGLQNDLVKSCVDHLFVTDTRQSMGFSHEPKDVIHSIELSEGILKSCKLLVKNKVLTFRSAGIEYTLLGDTVSALRTTLHQLEGGTVLVDSGVFTASGKKVKTPVLLKERSKIDFILTKFGDTADVAIMYNFKAERIKLEETFKNAYILQATRNAEGVDLHKIEHLVIYSQDYSTARHSQRRARQANFKRETPILVHHLIVVGGISEQVYKTVCVNKVNFIDSRFSLNQLEY